MTRPGDASERRRRIRLGYTPGADGTLHSPQPVEPEGRRKRRKASGHRHTEGQPPEDHGPDHDVDGSDPNPHTGSTANPHSVTHSQVGAPTGNPHGVTATEAGAVANAVGAPSLRRETRAEQPAPADVKVGTRSVIRDEDELEEVAADTTGDGNADTWVGMGSLADHGHDRHTAGSTPTFMASSSVAPQHIIDAADYTTSGADDQTEVNTALADLPGGTKTGE